MVKIESKVLDGFFLIDSRFTGSKSPIHDVPVYSGNKVSVEYRLNEDPETEGEKEEFNFYGSIISPTLDENSEDDLGNVLYCLLSDASCAFMPYEEFCDEFGYEKYSDDWTGKNQKALEIYDKCIDIRDQFYWIGAGIDENNIYDLINELGERFS